MRERKKKNKCIDCGEACTGKRCRECYNKTLRNTPRPKKICKSCGAECNGTHCRICIKSSARGAVGRWRKSRREKVKAPGYDGC